MKQQKRINQRGITLVALVITIIILLILAGITISQLTGSGLFENARLAEEKSKNAQEKENTVLGEYEKLIDGGYKNNNDYDINSYDKWVTLLYIAGIQNPEEYKEQDIVENESMINIILNNSSAVNYMLNSKNTIMSVICKSEIAIDCIVQNEKAKGQIIRDSDWKQEIIQNNFISKFDELAVKVPTSTVENENMICSDTVVYNSVVSAFNGIIPASGWNDSQCWLATSLYEDSYIGYNFNEPVSLYKFSLSSMCYESDIRKYSFILQGLTEEGAWENIGDEYLTNFVSKQKGVTNNYYVNVDKDYYGYRIKNNYSASGNGEQYWHKYGYFAIGITELQFYCVK